MVPELWEHDDGRKSKVTVELSALGRRDRGCSGSIFLGSCVLAFILLAARMKIHRCAYRDNAARTGLTLCTLHCLSQGLGQGVPSPLPGKARDGPRTPRM